MFSSRKLFVAAGLVCVLLLAVTSARADVISITNASFESPVVDNPSQTTQMPTGWDTAGYEEDPDGEDTPDISSGIYATGDFGDPLPDGVQCLAINAHHGYIWQNTGVELVPGYSYTLTFNSSAYDTADHRGFLMAADDTSTAGTSFADDSWTTSGWHDQSATKEWVEHSVTGTYSGSAGKYLSIALMGNGGWTGFDGVSASYDVPEPSAIMILASGLIGLLAYAWRKRK